MSATHSLQFYRPRLRPVLYVAFELSSGQWETKDTHCKAYVGQLDRLRW